MHSVDAAELRPSSAPLPQPLSHPDKGNYNIEDLIRRDVPDDRNRSDVETKRRPPPRRPAFHRERKLLHGAEKCRSFRPRKSRNFPPMPVRFPRFRSGNERVLRKSAQGCLHFPYHRHRPGRAFERHFRSQKQKLPVSTVIVPKENNRSEKEAAENAEKIPEFAGFAPFFCTNNLIELVENLENWTDVFRGKERIDAENDLLKDPVGTGSSAGQKDPHRLIGFRMNLPLFGSIQFFLNSSGRKWIVENPVSAQDILFRLNIKSARIEPLLTHSVKLVGIRTIFPAGNDCEIEIHLQRLLQGILIHLRSITERVPFTVAIEMIIEIFLPEFLS